MIVIALKFVAAVLIGLGWLFFGGENSKEIAVIFFVFVLAVLFITPKKFESQQDTEEFKRKVKEKQARQVALEEERILEKKQAKEKQNIKDKEL